MQPNTTTAPPPLAQLELSFECRNLKDLDSGHGKSDPQIEVFMQKGYNTKWFKVDETEVVWDNLNPIWTKKIRVDFFFDMHQPIRFEVWDHDSGSGRKNDDFLGCWETNLAYLAQGEASFVSLQKKLNPNTMQQTTFSDFGPSEPATGYTKGQILVKTEELRLGAPNKQFFFKAYAKNVRKPTSSKTPDVFLEFSRPDSNSVIGC